MRKIMKKSKGLIFFLAFLLLFTSACKKDDGNGKETGGDFQIREYEDQTGETKISLEKDGLYLSLKSTGFEPRKIEGLEGFENEITDVLIAYIEEIGLHEMGFDPAVFFLLDDGRLAWLLASEELPAQAKFLPFLGGIVLLDDNAYARDSAGLIYDLSKLAPMTNIFEKAWNGTLYLDDESDLRLGGLLEFSEDGSLLFQMIEGWQDDGPLLEEWRGSYEFVLDQEGAWLDRSQLWYDPLLLIDLDLIWWDEDLDTEGIDKKSTWQVYFAPSGEMEMTLLQGQSLFPLSRDQDVYSFWQPQD